jgi:hypothetical protein
MHADPLCKLSADRFVECSSAKSDGNLEHCCSARRLVTAVAQCSVLVTGPGTVLRAHWSSSGALTTSVWDQDILTHRF